MLLHGHYNECGSVWLWSWQKSLVLATFFLALPLVYYAVARHIAHWTKWTVGRGIRALYSTTSPPDIVLLCSSVLQA